MAKRAIDKVLESELTMTIGDHSGIKLKSIYFKPCEYGSFSHIYISPMDTGNLGLKSMYLWKIMRSHPDHWDYTPEVTLMMEGDVVTSMETILISNEIETPDYFNFIGNIDIRSKRITVIDPDGEGGFKEYTRNYSKRGDVSLAITVYTKRPTATCGPKSLGAMIDPNYKAPKFLTDVGDAPLDTGYDMAAMCANIDKRHGTHYELNDIGTRDISEKVPYVPPYAIHDPYGDGERLTDVSTLKLMLDYISAYCDNLSDNINDDDYKIHFENLQNMISVFKELTHVEAKSKRICDDIITSLGHDNGSVCDIVRIAHGVKRLLMGCIAFG